MREFRYVIKDEQGIHARPAGLFVKEAASCESKITISKDGKEVDAKRILGVMGLGVKKDQEIVLKAEGSDEDQAIENCQNFCRKISKKKSVGRRYVLWWNYKEKVFFPA